MKSSFLGHLIMQFIGQIILWGVFFFTRFCLFATSNATNTEKTIFSFLVSLIVFFIVGAIYLQVALWRIDKKHEKRLKERLKKEVTD